MCGRTEQVLNYFNWLMNYSLLEKFPPYGRVHSVTRQLNQAPHAARRGDKGQGRGART